ncbi:CHAT domain-containing tetratricopeptide repeat protein [Hyalangium sp.]|uniref:CHAT domain-containing tetratricopeptide repeat protein n=1 Tax=Hyalangium sp. TaxID=2028555 RepID=UPI002D57D8CA|nr:tetratricopeptide repeat protein [Hyalangium sp.]HYI01992.1 tetratricopeptide repeat protein [Hyalangium sp.]
MRQVFGWMMVVVVCGAAGAGASAEKPDSRLLEAKAAFDEATKLHEAGKYAEALKRAEQALALREAVLGGTHLEVASCLNLMGDLYRRQPNPLTHAEPLLQRALAIREAALGNNHVDVAQTLYTLAALYEGQGQYGRAEPLLQRAIAIREAVLGKNHPDVADALHLLAIVYKAQGSYAQAEPLFQRGLAIREAALGKGHPRVASSLNSLAALYWDQSLYDRAEPLYQRALAIREAALGKNHPEVAQSLNNLANLYAVQGLYGQAEPFYQRSLAVREAALGKNHPDVAQTLNNLAVSYMYQGLYGRAEPIYQRALAIREAALGKDHPDVASSLHNLALLYLSRGLYGQAEPLFQRALAIKEATVGKGHFTVASVLQNLALLYLYQGLYDRAEALFQRALAIQEAAFGKEHPDVAVSLSNLALVYLYQDLYDRAEPLLQRAITIKEAALGKRSPELAGSLSSLAIVYADQGLYGRAEPLFQRALAIEEAVLGKNHPQVAQTLNSLAVLYRNQGLYGRAEPLFQRALAIQEAVLGNSHRNVAQTLTDFGRHRLAQQRLADALPLFTRAFSISEQRLRQEALDFSESRLAGFLQYLRADEQALYSLLRAYPQDARAQRLAFSAVLLLKGRSIEETAHISRTLYRRLGAEDLDTFERLRGLRTRLATLSLAGPGSLTPEVYQQRLKSLAEDGDSLEADLAIRSAPLRSLTALPPPDAIVDRVAASLPKDSALVELVAYSHSPLVPKPGTARAKIPTQLRYLALVLFPDGSTRALDLGPAAPIDLAASRLRAALARNDAQFQTSARALYRLAFQPLLPLLGKTRRLFLSPDGQLGLVPFSALHDGRRFLLDSFDFIYLTSGRDLLPRPQDIPLASSVFVLADPDFTASPPAAASASGPLPTPVEPSASLTRFFSTARSDLGASSWVPLPGTRQEAESIQRLLPQAELFLGPDASKERLLSLSTPGILHLATHGFFLEDSPALSGSRAVGSFGALGDNPRAPRPQEPLLRSGLALAGARSLPPVSSSPSVPRPDAALVTALELAGLDLWGTQLVVLSACDTGRGDVKLGQGVYGLRRSLVVAGAETVVMSLWKVNDASTSQLMEAYYRNLLAGQGRASALREAMRSLRLSRPHPHYWAPFIALGSDASLRAIAPQLP